MVNEAKKRNRPDDLEDPLTGSFRVNKWGPSFNIQDILPIPYYYLDAIATSLSNSTWSSYKTAYNAFRNFMSLAGRPACFPISKDSLKGFVIYLYRARGLAPSTIRNYLAGLKCFHCMLDHPIDSFESTSLKYIIRGIENQFRALEDEGPVRVVFTFPMLQLVADALSRINIIPLDAQCFYTALCLGYFASFRMGDILLDDRGSNIDRILTWDRTQFVGDKHLLLSILHPKQAKTDKRLVCDVFHFPNKVFCPIENLQILAKMQRKAGIAQKNGPVFMLSSGATLRMSKVNSLLKKLLMPSLDASIGSVTCHSLRAGLPSLMAANPATFTNEETLLQGDWHSDSFKVYTRMNNIGRQKTHKKVVATLMGQLF